MVKLVLHRLSSFHGIADASHPASKSGAFMTLPRPFQFLARFSLISAIAALAACEEGSSLSQRAMAPIPAETVALMDQAGSSREAPTLIRAFKKEAELEVWKMRSDGRYAHVKTYPMCRWSGQLGPKTREGDRQVPEGFYTISPGQLNPNSAYYLSFNVGYPNTFDRAWNRTGGTIMVHGVCSSMGCFSMTDRQIAEIYAIVRTSLNNGQNAVQMQSYPFRMTAENMAKHRLDPNISFWKQLKEGNDHFEVAKREPVVGVCGKRYVFDVTPANGKSLDPVAACPPLKEDPQIAQAVREKEAQDNAKIAELSSNVKPVRLVYQDGGQHPYFASRVAEVSRPEALVPPTEVALEEKATIAPAKPRAMLASRSSISPGAVKAAALDANKTVVPATEKPAATVAALAADPDVTGKISVRDWQSLHKESEPSQNAPAAHKKKSASADVAKVGSLEKALHDAQAKK
jgi:murein L,D-transpeptidase YafK